MRKFSPMLVGAILCTVALVGLAAVKHSDRPPVETVMETAAPADPGGAPLVVQRFMTEGPEGALRINFIDLDLLKLADVQTITPDCVTRIPVSVKELEGEIIRLRGFMKPNSMSTGISQFLFVRSTDMCCFGPMGRVDHLTAVNLKPDTTTDYIEFRPFDVEGRFRIELREEDGIVFLLYHLDDAVIIQR
jgi:hypothetical protein